MTHDDEPGHSEQQAPDAPTKPSEVDLDDKTAPDGTPVENPSG